MFHVAYYLNKTSLKTIEENAGHYFLQALDIKKFCTFYVLILINYCYNYPVTQPDWIQARCQFSFDTVNQIF